MSAEVVWHGVLLPREEYNDSLVAAADALADAARDGAWARVFALLDDRAGVWSLGANDWRRGGDSWFSPLHQAAWHGASIDVVEGLVARAAWRALREADGHRPVDIARERGADHLLDALEPRFTGSPSEADLAGMSAGLAGLVEEAAGQARCTAPIRHLDAACVAESDGTVWFPIPGMYGGFSVRMFHRRLHVESWSRVVGGSGRAYVITGDRVTLVDEGFV